MIMSSTEALQNEHLMQTSRAGAVMQGESTALRTQENTRWKTWSDGALSGELKWSDATVRIHVSKQFNTDTH